MIASTAGSRFARCSAVQVGVTTALGSVLALVLPMARSLPTAMSRQRFDDLLVSGCAGAALVAAAWLWVVTTVVVAQALLGARPGDGRRAVPAGVRRVVLAACGAALLAPAAPAAADEAAGTGDRRGDVSVLHGLPVPERATSSAAWVAPVISSRTVPPPPSSGRTTVVRPGDTLWSLAAAGLSPDAPPAAVTRRWQRVHDLNRAVIGDDPDLIHPGQQLRLPPAPHGGVQP